jgi:hypothetical protein
LALSKKPAYFQCSQPAVSRHIPGPSRVPTDLQSHAAAKSSLILISDF